jgi:hypothetical protein
MICPKCGEESDTTDLICPFCEANMAENEEKNKVYSNSKIVNFLAHLLYSDRYNYSFFAVIPFMLAWGVFYFTLESWLDIDKLFVHKLLFQIVLCIFVIFTIIAGVLCTERVAKSKYNGAREFYLIMIYETFREFTILAFLSSVVAIGISLYFLIIGDKEYLPYLVAGLIFATSMIIFNIFKKRFKRK